jgi:hypothetical protein
MEMENRKNEPKNLWGNDQNARNSRNSLSSSGQWRQHVGLKLAEKMVHFKITFGTQILIHISFYKNLNIQKISSNKIKRFTIGLMRTKSPAITNRTTFCTMSLSWTGELNNIDIKLGLNLLLW